MKILVTNDDGIHAPGLDVAERIARSLSDDVWVVAPETDQSGVAHAADLSDPIRMRQVDERRYAIRGTPTDCVIMGFKVVIGEKPDLVISGVNRGQNIADDILYSGTVAGATEGTLSAFPSIALSQAYGLDTRDNPLWETAEAHGPRVISRLIAEGFRRRHPVQHQLPELRAGGGARHGDHPPRQAHPRLAEGRAAQGRPRLPVLLDRLPALQDGPGRGDRPLRHRQQRDFGDAAVARLYARRLACPAFRGVPLIGS
jgi:5'-nucleotidase